MGRFTALNDPIGVSDSVRVLAMIELGEGNLQDARTHAESALTDTQRVGHLLLEGELLEVLAAIARKADESGHAAKLEAEASVSFEKARAPAWGERFRALTAEL
jgi:hypothetical protein